MIYTKKKMFVILSTALVIIFIALVLAYGYLNFGPRQANYWLTKSTPLVEETIGSYSLGQNIKDINLSPATITKVDEDYDNYSIPSGLTITTLRRDNKIIRIWDMNSDGRQETSKGIHRGSSQNDVIAVYGKNYYHRSEQGVNIVGYIDKKKQQTLEFWIYENNVTAVRLDIASMK